MQGLLRTLLVFLACLTAASAQTVVVLPFFNRSKSASVDWIGETISESIREALFAEGVLVLDRESREEGYRRLSLHSSAELTKASILKIGETLDADRVVHGAFEVTEAKGGTSPSGSALSITAQVIDRTQLRESPPFSEAAKLDELAALQDRVAQRISEFLQGKAAASEAPSRPRRPVRLDAMENYIRGLMAQDPDQKHRFFTQAARLDEGFSQPCFQLGKLSWEKKEYRVAAGWLERVASFDAHFHEARFFLGLCRYYLGEYDKAAAAFRQVAEPAPLNEVWNNLGAAQSRLNRPEAVESFRRALEGDPNDPVYNFNTGYALWKRGAYEDAAARFRAVLDGDPEDTAAMSMLGRCLQGIGPGQTETRLQSPERLKHNYDEMAYRQLQAALAPKAGVKSPPAP